MAVTVNYQVPGIPGFTVGTTPPTQAQMANLSMVLAQVTFADGDLLGTVTHNMQIPTQAALNTGTPLLAIYPLSLGTTPQPILGSLASSNTVVLSKGSVVGSNGTYQVTILKPNTVIE
jgi:hypothetical protein